MLWVFLRVCRRKDLNKPIISKWVIVACVRKSRRAGIFGASRSDFPEMGVSVNSNLSFRTNTAGANPHFIYIKSVSLSQANKYKCQYRVFVVLARIQNILRQLMVIFCKEFTVHYHFFNKG